MDYDVVVIGSGAAAMAAAVTAAAAGLQVLVAEKGEHFGGTGAWSGGVAWVPNNPHTDECSRDTGEHDSRERMLRYFTSVVGEDRMRPALMNAFYDNGRKMTEFFERNTEVQFERTTYPDYKAHLDGGMPMGRSMQAVGYDGRKLGAWFPRLRRPMPQMCLFGSMMIDGNDARSMMTLTRSPRAMARMTRLSLRHVIDLALYRRGARLTMGNALLGRLLKSALDRGVTLWPEAGGTRLLMDDGRVTGVVLQRGGQEVQVGVRRGVVLGAGGFSHDEKLKHELIPNPDQHETVSADTNTGDGIRMGLAAGGRMGRSWQNFLGTQITMMRDKTGKVIAKIPFMRLDRNKPGYVLVNRHGRRFVNEAWPYNDVAHEMNDANDAVPAWLICDHVRLRRYGLGLVRPGPAWLRPLRRFLDLGHLAKGATLDELAGKLGIDAAGLRDTVACMNEYARTGVDLEFHKGETAYDRWQGDAAVTPNPSLGPIETGPFYAVTLWPGDLGTFCGLVTDEQARVLDAQDAPIAGLYAVGGDMHPMLTGSYPGGGGSIGPGMVFGFIAGNSLAGNQAAAIEPNFPAAAAA